MPKVKNTVTQTLALIQDKYSGMGVKVIHPAKIISQESNDLIRALSLIKLFGNVVFISEAKEQGDRLAGGVLGRLNSQEAVQLDIRKLIEAEKARAGSLLREIIHLLGEAEGKISLVIADLEDAVKDSSIICALLEAVKQKSFPILGITGIEGFRKLQENPGFSGFLQFILCERKETAVKRDKSVLIIGATSLLGNAVYQLFSREYAVARGTGFSKADSLGFDKLDSTSEDKIREYFSKQPHFDIVIYISGEANADVAEKERERARALNTEAVGTIARYAKNCKFVYISTEYIFDGSTGPYGSGSAAKPINYYGTTKLEGEQVALNNFPGALILRLGALYGYNGPFDKATSVSKLIASMSRAEPIKADNVQIKHPILLEDAAGTLLKLLDYGVSGIFQANGSEGLNKQEMAERIATVWKEVTGSAFSYPIVGVEQAGGAGKPLNTHMVNVDTPRPFNEGIRFMLLKQAALKEKKDL